MTGAAPSLTRRSTFARLAAGAAIGSAGALALAACGQSQSSGAGAGASKQAAGPSTIRYAFYAFYASKPEAEI